MRELFQKLKGQLIVSCQALEEEPLHGSNIMARMAKAAKDGGAAAIRANGLEDIIAIKKTTNLPVIGIVKREYPNCEIYITPTMREVDEIVIGGVEIIAIDLTNRIRPDRVTNKEFIKTIKRKYPHVYIMGDISSYEEGITAESLGVDLIATTLSGYTSYTKKQKGPDFELISKLSLTLSIPLIAEGRVNTPDDAAECIRLGAWAVVVGSAITRPQLITKTFTDRLGQTVFCKNE
ncbi:N-acetylmannosamine-6-phosphate 2-epimerase [Neobacillus drentensis]|uniref:N-acetylmannosamine-6-phosphate 2-epimerase n=1 Tax=Neobacillus drentensis TaxID=220684 RepID=UPI002FFE20CD